MPNYVICQYIAVNQRLAISKLRPYPGIAPRWQIRP